MQGDGFILTGKERMPSRFQAACLFFIALLGLPVCSYLVIGLRMLLGAAQQSLSDNTYSIILYVIYYTLCILLPVGILGIRHPGLWNNIRVRPLKTSNALLIALAAPFGVMFVTSLSYIWLMLIEALGGTITDTEALYADSAKGLMGLVLLSAVLPAVCEELLFRGVMLSAWEEKGSYKAMFIVSAWFMLTHASIAGMPAEFISGVIIAFLVISTDSLFAGIIYHTVHNAVILIINNLNHSAETAAQGPSTYYEMAGGAQGVISMMFFGLLMGGILVFILRALYRSNVKGDFGVPASGEREKSISEYLVIICGLVLALLMYLADVLQVLGIIA